MQNSHSTLLWNISLCELQVWGVKNCWQLKRSATWVTAVACRSGLLCKILSTSDCRGYIEGCRIKRILVCVFWLAVLQITHLSVTNVYNRLLGDSAVLTEVRRCFYYDFSGIVYNLYCILGLYLICICICIRIFPDLYLTSRSVKGCPLSECHT